MADANMKTISQKTGEFIDDDAAEPGYVVNMDDPGAQAFIDKIKGVSSPVSVGPITSTGQAATAAAEVPAPQPVSAPVTSNPLPAATKVAESSPPTRSAPVAAKTGRK